MENKVVLILVDGMRPEALSMYAQDLIAQSTAAMATRTVMPSVTLPCHMSLFHSVEPSRHGILSNDYTPQVRPIDGLFERLYAADKRSAMFYNWEQLRDLERPGHMAFACYHRMHVHDESDRYVTDAALAYIARYSPDFVFLYLGETDEMGHDKGWMSAEYLERVENAVSCARRVIAEATGYTVLLTADHGGHDRCHGTDKPEDMTIPLLLHGDMFEAGAKIENASILDIAPTIVRLLGATPAREWEGKPLIG